MNDIQREIAIDEETFDLASDNESIDADLAHKLLAERSKLLEGCEVCGSEGARKDADALKKCEDSLKRIIDKNGGYIVDEEFGRVTFDHGQYRVGWDEKRLQAILGPYYNELEWDVRQSSLTALIEQGKASEHDLRPAAKMKPKRGAIKLTPLPRSIRDV